MFLNFRERINRIQSSLDTLRKVKRNIKTFVRNNSRNIHIRPEVLQMRANYRELKTVINTLETPDLLIAPARRPASPVPIVQPIPLRPMPELQLIGQVTARDFNNNTPRDIRGYTVAEAALVDQERDWEDALAFANGAVAIDAVPVQNNNNWLPYQALIQDEVPNVHPISPSISPALSGESTLYSVFGESSDSGDDFVQ